MALSETYREITRREARAVSDGCDGAEIIAVAYGTTARIVRSAVARLRERGVRAGLVRPVTLWPFPSEAVRAAAAQPSVKAVLSVEMSTGQMIDDVRIAVAGAKPVHFYGRTGGMVPMPDDIADEIARLAGGDR
jgi:2-oxoglutarate ferredoxin oxidoreductase subunit alpha